MAWGLPIDFRTIFMNACRGRHLNLSTQTSEVLRSHILFECQPSPEELRENIHSAINYVQKLPIPVLEELFSYFKSPDRNFFLFNSFKSIDAWHVALFVYEGQPRLILDFVNRDFDLEFLFDVCGNKMQCLEELKLPEQCKLTCNACKKMCESAANLKKLNIRAVEIANFAMQYVADLPLVELEMGGMTLVEPIMTISPHTLYQHIVILCRKESTCRLTMRSMSVGESVNPECYMLILRSMPNLEELDFPACNWLVKLPEDMKSMKFKLKKLTFINTNEKLERELDIAVKCFPLVHTVDLATDNITREIVEKLTQFKNLTTLSMRTVNSKSVDHAKGSSTERMEVDNVCDVTGLNFPNLTHLAICDKKNFWLSSGNNFINFLAICPQLSSLIIRECSGFDDQVANRMSRHLSKGKLEALNVEFCNSLRPNGIRKLLDIPSVTDCVVQLLLPGSIKRVFDIEQLKDFAKRKGKNLTLLIVLRTIFHDLFMRSE